MTGSARRARRGACADGGPGASGLPSIKLIYLAESVIMLTTQGEVEVGCHVAFICSFSTRSFQEKSGWIGARIMSIRAEMLKAAYGVSKTLYLFFLSRAYIESDEVTTLLKEIHYPRPHLPFL
ncbi:hypothetical protein RRG08_059669 [Elysia crispata]|uniref:Uncharacterized protein n=1 Tax=Elysia crispata TaxID=231223 RepID=A0AAE1B4Z1_9GAST|nr:hypothetical protein RRG08_059669 [Elysia crispata]